MPNIVLNTKTYNGSGIANGVAGYMERSSGLAAGFSPLTAVVKALETGKSRISWKMFLPIVADEASSCSCPGQVLRVSDVNISIRLDPGATLTERTDFALRLKDLVASPEFQASIISLQQPVG